MSRKRAKNGIRVGFIALGCPKAVVDSERMLALIGRAGFLIVAEPTQADVIVVNTCGFIAPATAESLEAIGWALELKRKGYVQKVIAAGCLPERIGDKLLGEAKGIDGVVGLGYRDDIAEVIKDVLKSDRPKVYVGGDDGIFDDTERLLIGPRHRAYLRVSEGCNHRCSFCTIPAIRGRFRSKRPEDVIAEAEELVSAGVAELNIIGQDTASYGRDSGVRDGLVRLIDKLERIDGLSWVRLLYLYPEAITDDLIDAVAESNKVVHYFDIPIQHINDEILGAMRRAGRKQDIIGLIEKVRRAMPDVVLRTTVMAGFPSESDKQFAELLEFVADARFDCLGCFRYQAEAGTDAARMSGQIPESVKRQRCEAVMLAQQRIAFEKNNERIGEVLNCLVDSVEGPILQREAKWTPDEAGNGRGRFYGQAADIDGVCIIRDCRSMPGEFVEVEVIEAQGYDLIVKEILS